MQEQNEGRAAPGRRRVDGGDSEKLIMIGNIL
jgi:hypothetical protein